MKIDVFTRIDDLAREQLERAEPITLPGSTQGIRVATAEDIILSKLICFKKENEQSERQWRDILGVLSISGKSLDRSYLQRWAECKNVDSLLVRAMEAAGN